MRWRCGPFEHHRFDRLGQFVSRRAERLTGDGQGGEAFYTYWQERGPHGLGGTPWEVRDRYIENSPVFTLDRVTTPLLLVHADEDVTIPPFLGDEIFVSLRRLGRPVTYLRYAGQEHVPARWTLPNQIDYAHCAIAWFDAHLKGPS